LVLPRKQERPDSIAHPPVDVQEVAASWRDGVPKVPRRDGEAVGGEVDQPSQAVEGEDLFHPDVPPDLPLEVDETAPVKRDLCGAEGFSFHMCRKDDYRLDAPRQEERFHEDPEIPKRAPRGLSGCPDLTGGDPERMIVGHPVLVVAHIRHGRRDTDGPAARVGHLLPDLNIDTVPELLPEIPDAVISGPVDDSAYLDRHHHRPGGAVDVTELHIEVGALVVLILRGQKHREEISCT